MALEARKRRRRATSTATRRRRRSVSVYAKAPIRRRRRRGLSEGGLSARGGYTALALQFFEAGAGAIAATAVGKLLPVQNPYIKALAGAGISVLTATQLKRPILGAGMAAVFAADFIKGFNIPGLSEMAQGDFVSESDLSQPNMVYLSPSGEPVFMQEGGEMLYADGSDSGMSAYDYES
jgi:hypothetical protein